MKNNVVGWFEIPVSNMDRAIKFYATVFGFELQREQMGPLDMAWFPSIENAPGSGGSLVHHEAAYKPSADGVLLYFTAHSGDLSNELSRVEAAGGKVLLEKRLITEEIGYMGLFLDSEGNRIAMHSRE
ncbi:MAG: VOC family protein [Saprospiraceae bacterium]|nr:VOC family protein [Saprospiraceae bacterium]